MNDTEATGDLTVTALYTSAVWWWAGFEGSELLITPQARAVFRVTNVVLWIAGRILGTPYSLRHGLAARHRMIDALARDAGATTYLELASGLSRRGVAFTRGGGVEYVEVDLPHVVSQKRALLDQRPTEHAGQHGLTLVPADVSDLDLSTLVRPSDAPICVMAEGLLMYLDPEQQRALFSRVAELLHTRPGSTFLFDLLPGPEHPRVGAVGRVLGRVMRWFTRGQGFRRDQRGRAALIQDVKRCGFAEVTVYDAKSREEGVTPMPMVVFACGGAMLPYAGTLGS